MSRVNATPLDATVISEMLPTHTRDALDIVVLDVVGSTNDVVRDGCATGGCQRLVVFAEQQTAGRGRRGKTWHSRREQISTVLSAGNARARWRLCRVSVWLLVQSWQRVLRRTSAYNCSSNGRTTSSIRSVNSGACWLNCWVSRTAGTMR